MQMVNTVKDGKIDSSLQQSMVALMKYAKNLSAKFFFCKCRCKTFVPKQLINAKSNQIFPGAFAIKHHQIVPFSAYLILTQAQYSHITFHILQRPTPSKQVLGSNYPSNFACLLQDYYSSYDISNILIVLVIH